MYSSTEMQNHTPRSFAGMPQLAEGLGSTDVLHLVLSAKERREMERLIPKGLNPYQDFQYFAAHALRSIVMMNPESVQSIRDFATNAEASGVMLVSGLPTDRDLPPTPLDGEPAKDRASFVGEATLLGLASLIGEPIGYETEKDGQIIHNLVPIKGSETTQSNRGSTTFLSFHNDSVYDADDNYHVFNPDYLILYGHRADPAKTAKTYYVSARRLQQVLPPDCVEALREPVFRMAAPANFTDLLNDGEKRWSKPMPILFGHAETPEIAVAANGVKPLTKAAERALDALMQACADPANQTEALVDSGTAMLINNRKGLHARSSFLATYSEAERWLLRANIRQNVWPLRDRVTSRSMVFS